MLIWTTRFSKKKAILIVLIFGVIVAACILLAGRADAPEESVMRLTGNEERIAYLQSLGWEVDPEPIETLQCLLPDALEEPYLSYNELQKQQGFDLSSCCGKQISRYTYQVTNYPGQENVQANLYLCEEKVVAGDLLCPGENGFQEALIPAENPA